MRANKSLERERWSTFCKMNGAARLECERAAASTQTLVAVCSPRECFRAKKAKLGLKLISLEQSGMIGEVLPQPPSSGTDTSNVMFLDAPP
jgi:hypothetical protein